MILMKRIYTILFVSVLWLIIPSLLYSAPPDQESLAPEFTRFDGQEEGNRATALKDSTNPLAPFVSMDLGGIYGDTSLKQRLGGVKDSHGSPIKISQRDTDEDLSEEELPEDFISDPLEPLNRIFFHFNDKLYFWLLKPLATGYKAVVPQPVRVGVRQFFYNLAFPIRFFNCLLQAKFEGAGIELLRFIVNTTVGAAGFVDVVKDSPTLREYKKYEEDLGQTLGSYGLGHGFYINWPILGPSSVRDTFGLLGDVFLDPVNYMVPRTKYNLSVRSYNGINKTSLAIGEYEDLKKAALDPYVSLRDAYYQYRKNQIKH